MSGRKAVAAALASLAASTAILAPLAAQEGIVRVERPVRVQLDAMPTGALVTLLMRDVMKVPYIIAPEVLADRRPISVNLVMARADIPKAVIGYLRGVGFTVQLSGGTVYVTGGRRVAGGGGALPGQISGNPLDRQTLQPSFPGQAQPGEAQPTPPMPGEIPPYVGPGAAYGAPPAPVDIAVVIPSHREPGDFVDMLKTVLPGLNVAARSDSEARDLEIAAPSSPDRLVLSGSTADVDKAVQVIAALDVPRPVLSVSALVVEMSDRSSRGSALQVVADLFGGKILGGSYGADAPGPQSIGFSIGGLSAILSAVKEDGRFSVIAEPTVSVESGSVATLNAGAEVPTLGAVTFSEGGQPTRSVVYRSSGLTLTVRPVLLGGMVQLAVEQERSSFSRTNTGVDDSPTLNQTSVSSQFTVRPGQLVALAGVEERSDSQTKQGLFGGLLGSRSSEKSNSQVVVLLSAEVQPLPERLPPHVVYIRHDGASDVVSNPAPGVPGGPARTTVDQAFRGEA